MTTEIEKQFFDMFGVEPCFRNWQQYNFGRVEDGLKLFPERQKLADEGYIKITCKKLNPTEFNDCVYWEEYHYPQITDRILLELICIVGNVTIKNTIKQCELLYADGAVSYLGKTLKEALLNLLISKVSIFKHQVQALFKEG